MRKKVDAMAASRINAVDHSRKPECISVGISKSLEQNLNHGRSINFFSMNLDSDAENCRALSENANGIMKSSSLSISMKRYEDLTGENCDPIPGNCQMHSCDSRPHCNVSFGDHERITPQCFLARMHVGPSSQPLSDSLNAPASASCFRCLSNEMTGKFLDADSYIPKAFSPESVLRNAAKSFKNIPSIIRKRTSQIRTQTENHNVNQLPLSPTKSPKLENKAHPRL